MNGLKVYFLQVTSSGTFASAMVSTKSELNQSPGGSPNLESPGESYEPLKSRERATGEAGPTRRGEFAQTTPMVFNIMLIAFVSTRRTTFVFGPSPSEASTRRYGRSNNQRSNKGEDMWTN